MNSTQFALIAVSLGLVMSNVAIIFQNKRMDVLSTHLLIVGDTSSKLVERVLVLEEVIGDAHGE